MNIIVTNIDNTWRFATYHDYIKIYVDMFQLKWLKYICDTFY